MRNVGPVWRLFLGAVLALVTASSQAAVGKIQGSGAVSATGAATYDIPLRLPPGPNGIQPALSLIYNSQRGNGILGPGWALSGLPSITRCNRTIAQDGVPSPVTLSFGDAFCLDGKRLRITNGPPSNYGQPGSVYDTEIAEFSQITAFGTAGNGPAYFILKAKSGLIYEFGFTPDSRITPAGSISTAYVWLLNKVRNREGVSYAISYGTGAAGSVGVGVPQTISYAPATVGGSYTHSISFSYGAKAAQMPGTTDPAVVGYVGGVRVVNTNLLLGIEARISGVLTRKYTLGYEAAPATTRARLKTITECAGSDGTDCLSPTTITYQNGAAGVVPTAVTAASNTNLAFQGVADFDLDGRDDLLYTGLSTVYVVFSTASGFSSPVVVGTSTVVEQFSFGRAVVGTGQGGILIGQSNSYVLYRWNGVSGNHAA